MLFCISNCQALTLRPKERTEEPKGGVKPELNP